MAVEMAEGWVADTVNALIPKPSTVNPRPYNLNATAYNSP